MKKNFLITRSGLIGLICVSLVFLPVLVRAQGDVSAARHWQHALNAYAAGDYPGARWHTGVYLEMVSRKDIRSRARAYLFMGICYEKENNAEWAENCYMTFRSLAGHGKIKRTPSIARIDYSVFPIFLRIMNQKKIRSRQVIEKIGKKSVLKKDMLWFYLGSAVLLTAAGLFLAKGKTSDSDVPAKIFSVNDIVWVEIPQGSFQMGDHTGTGNADERPVHEVYLNRFYISKYEITAGQFKEFCDATGWKTYPTSPVVYSYFGNVAQGNISWQGAREFCKWLSVKTGAEINLPTEAQWEKAARGTTQNIYVWGNDKPRSHFCNFSGFEDWAGTRGPMSVGSFAMDVSVFGVYDMAGNLSELTRDFYSPTYYAVSEKNNPTGPRTGLSYSVRGGSFFSPGVNLRCSWRSRASKMNRQASVGFRIVKETD